VSDTSADSPPLAPVSGHGFVAGIKAFSLWLGGSLAGISAMLYATGYLITRAHLNLLGLYGIVDFGNDYIVQEGAKFFLVIGYSYVLGVILPLLAIAAVAAIVPLALAAMLRKTLVRLGDRVRALPYSQACCFSFFAIPTTCWTNSRFRCAWPISFTRTRAPTARRAARQ
jgi:hypothetical protein